MTIALPELDGLGGEALSRVAGTVMRNSGPAILRRMVSVGSAYAAGDAGQLDLMAAELEFQHFMSYARRLYPHAGDPAPDRFAELRLTPSQRAEATIRLVFSPDSPFLVHGPILLGRIGLLCSRLLQPGETLLALRDTRLRRPVFQDVRVTVTAGHQPDERDDAVVFGRLETNLGRDLWFQAVEQVDAPVAGWFDNDFSCAMIDRIVSGRRADRIAFTLRPPCTPLGCSLIGSEGGRLQLLLDALVHLTVMARGRTGRAILVSAVDYCAIPPARFFARRHRATMRVDVEAITTSRNGFQRVPLVIRLGNAELLRLVIAERRAPVPTILAALPKPR